MGGLQQAPYTIEETDNAMNPIQGPLRPPTPPPMPAMSPSMPMDTEEVPSFKNLLMDGIEQVNAMQHQADTAVQQLMTGDDIDPAAVLTTVQKADMSFRMMMQIRNKLMQAFQEIKEIRI